MVATPPPRAADAGDPRFRRIGRSFAYASGPAYGALLETRDPRWTRRLGKADDLALLVGMAFGVKPAAAIDSAAYDARALVAAERAREEARQARLRAYRARFVEGPTLTLPLAHMNMQFDPNEAAPFPEPGTVYPRIHLTDDWGTLDVRNGGALISSDWRTLVVPRRPGDDHTLTLADGWELAGETVRRR